MSTPAVPASSEDGERFGFGQNWRHFSSHIDESRIAESERSLRDMLGLDSLEGMSFLDAGCGSGLSSLAAARMGAERIHSFDLDADSVACTTELRDAHGFSERDWRVESGSVLDQDYLRSLGKFDIVYSWGVLHHTGQLARAMETVLIPLADPGTLFVALYNDQGRWSRLWGRIKRTYNRLPGPLRLPFVALVISPFELPSLGRAIRRRRPEIYLDRWRQYKHLRGMSRWHDYVDWVGGYPFEVARPGDVFDFYRNRGFSLERLNVTQDWGCNEFVFRRQGRPDSDGTGSSGSVSPGTSAEVAR